MVTLCLGVIQTEIAEVLLSKSGLIFVLIVKIFSQFQLIVFFVFFFDLLILEVKPISTGISYRRPNVNTFLDIFFNKLTHIDLHKNEVYFLGDFNVNLLLNDKCILKFILTMLNIFLIGYHSRTYVTRNKQHFLPS